MHIIVGDFNASIPPPAVWPLRFSHRRSSILELSSTNLISFHWNYAPISTSDLCFCQGSGCTLSQLYCPSSKQIKSKFFTQKPQPSLKELHASSCFPFEQLLGDSVRLPIETDNTIFDNCCFLETLFVSTANTPSKVLKSLKRHLKIPK